MIDIKRLAKAWEIFRDSNPYEICDGREFRAIKEPEYCMGQMIEDTITLLKKQEAVEPTWSRGKPFCGACGSRIYGGKFCSDCGKPILWKVGKAE